MLGILCKNRIVLKWVGSLIRKFKPREVEKGTPRRDRSSVVVREDVRDT